ncbi:MAG TPA: tryptophan-rich sensory protein [Saprospiraceae bacterium]|nr:tryptophan-rich sensory protein [Saprospiraceae bacterium]
MNHMTTGEISSKYPTLITPSSTAFLIWPLIYVLLFAFIVKIWIDYHKRLTDNIIVYKKLLPFFIIQCFANILWLITWHYERTYLSVSVMFILLISLIYIYFEVKNTALWVFPWEIYLGWISVAAIVNVAVAFTKAGWIDQMGNSTGWTMIMLVVASFLSLIFLWRENSFYFTMVNIWALIHIAIGNKADTSIYFAALAFISVQFLIVYYVRRMRADSKD